jgi:uncharacterized protein with HEPN domain
MRDNARLAKEWTEGVTRSAFERDQKTFYAVTRCLEIISEASRSLPREMLDRHPEMPWQAMKDAGNHYRHRYDNVAEDLVWKTVRQDLDPLILVVNSELARIAAAAAQKPEPVPSTPEIEGTPP